MPWIGNWPLLERAIEHIIDHPEHYWQGEWRYVMTDDRDVAGPLDYRLLELGKCGTTRCVAGWIAALDGWEDTPDTLAQVTRPGHDQTWTDQAALMSLGTQRLTPEERGEIHSLLFSGGATWHSILVSIEDFAERDGHTLSAKIQAHMASEGVAS